MAVLLHADGALLAGRGRDQLRAMLAGLARAGSRVGMGLHWDKFHFVSVRCDVNLSMPSGDPIQPKDSM
eukprot:2088058-Pyramimonas_sp.AAC.1